MGAKLAQIPQLTKKLGAREMVEGEDTKHQFFLRLSLMVFLAVVFGYFTLIIFGS